MKIKLLSSRLEMKPKNFTKKLAQFSLILSLMVVAAACGGGDNNQNSENRQSVKMENSTGGNYSRDDYNRDDYNQRSENRQSVRVSNGKVEVDCSGSSEGTTSTTTVNGQTYRCENGQARKVR